MTRFLAILCLLFLMSCEEQKLKTEDSVGDNTQFIQAPLASDDVARLKAICNAVSMKEDQLSVLISSQYTFSYAEKKCGESSIGAAQDVKVSIERPYGNYVFMKESGDNFAFPDVETTSMGVLASICKMSSFVSPITTSSTGALWFTTKSNIKHCSPGSTQYCLHIQKGSLVGNNTYKIHTNEWIKFKLDNPRRGFFVERKLISSASCDSKKTIERRAVLK